MIPDLPNASSNVIGSNDRTTTGRGREGEEEKDNLSFWWECIRTAFPNLGDAEKGKKGREKRREKEGRSDSRWRTRASGKRRRGAYQRHLLIYFAAAGRPVHGRGSSLGFAPTNPIYRHYYHH